MYRIAVLTIASILPLVAASAATPVPLATIRAELAPTGTLRAGINYNNPLLATRDASTGELRGLAVDLSRELARRVGVPVKLIPYDAAGKMTADAKSGAWDIAYFAIDPARGADVDYTAAHSHLEGTYLVPPGSTLQKIADVDRAGVRIAVTTGSAYDLFLSRELKHAQLVRAQTTPQSIAMMMEQKLDAVAAVRTAAVAGARSLPGSRVLDGHFMIIPQAAALPKGRPAAARYVSEFIEEMKATGFVAAAMTRHGLTPDDAVVAPLARTTAAVRVATYIELKSASTRAGWSLLTQYARATRAEPGNVEVHALQETARPNRFVIVESWQHQAAFAEHEKAAHTRLLREQLKSIHRGPFDQRINSAFAVDPRAGAAGPKAVNVVTHVDVPGARREEAEVLLKRLVAASRQDAGNVRYDVYQQADPRTNHFTVFAVWDRQQAFEASGNSPHWQQFREALGPMLGALYDERIYRAGAAR
jgi:polar amino acid transport system substrate-binding protein